MEYVIFAAATLILAFSFPHWEITGRIGATARASRLLGFTGVVGHLGGTAAIAWSSGFGAGAIAFLVIPLAASLAYTLVVQPRNRSRHAMARATPPRLIP